jgi:hypothetical protein
VADRRAGEQAAHGLGHRREGLIGGELPQHDRHRGGGDEGAAEEGQQGEEHRGVAGGLDALGRQPESGGQPDEGEAEQHQHADRAEPVQRVGGGPEAERDRDDEHDGDAGQGLDEAGQDVAREHGGTGDRHGAEAVDDASGHVHGDDDRGALDGGGDGHQQDAEVGHQLQVLLAGQQLVQRGELAGDPDRSAQLVGVRAQVVAGQSQVAGVGGEQNRQDPHDCRLAGAVRPEQREDRAFGDRDVDVVEHQRLADSVSSQSGKRWPRRTSSALAPAAMANPMRVDNDGRVSDAATNRLRLAVDSDRERSADLAHARVGEPAEPLGEHAQRDALDGVEVNRTRARNRVLGRLEHHLARQ